MIDDNLDGDPAEYTLAAIRGRLDHVHAVQDAAFPSGAHAVGSRPLDGVPRRIRIADHAAQCRVDLPV